MTLIPRLRSRWRLVGCAQAKVLILRLDLSTVRAYRQGVQSTRRRAGQHVTVEGVDARVTWTGELVFARLPAIRTPKMRAASVEDCELIAALAHHPNRF